MHYRMLLSSMLLMALCASCVTSKTLRNEKSMEEWLESAALPVTVQFQRNGVRCKPTLNCYTLIDAKGKVYYAANVRHQLPRMMPEDTTMIRPRIAEWLFGFR